MKRNMRSRIVAVMLLLAIVVQVTPVHTEAAGHVHSDACYSGHRHASNGCTLDYSYTGFDGETISASSPVIVNFYCKTCHNKLFTYQWFDYYNGPGGGYSGDRSVIYCYGPSGQIGVLDAYNNLGSQTGNYGGYTQTVSAINDLQDILGLSPGSKVSTPYLNLHGCLWCAKVWSCGLSEDTVTLCSQIVTDVAIPVLPYLVPYGVAVQQKSTITYLDGTQAYLNISASVNANLVGEQDITAGLGSARINTANNITSLLKPAKAIVYKTCPTCSNRYISSSCLICKCNAIGLRAVSVSRYSGRLSNIKSDTVTIKQNVKTLQDSKLY